MTLCQFRQIPQRTNELQLMMFHCHVKRSDLSLSTMRLSHLAFTVLPQSTKILGATSIRRESVGSISKRYQSGVLCYLGICFDALNVPWCNLYVLEYHIDKLQSAKMSHNFEEVIFWCIFCTNKSYSDSYSLKFVPQGKIDIGLTHFQVMADDAVYW